MKNKGIDVNENKGRNIVKKKSYEFKFILVGCVFATHSVFMFVGKDDQPLKFALCLRMSVRRSLQEDSVADSLSVLALSQYCQPWNTSSASFQRSLDREPVISTDFATVTIVCLYLLFHRLRDQIIVHQV